MNSSIYTTQELALINSLELKIKAKERWIRANQYLATGDNWPRQIKTS